MFLSDRRCGSFFESIITATTRGLSRCSDMSLRTWFRFLAESYKWVELQVRFFNRFIFDLSKVYILVTCETVKVKIGNWVMLNINW